MLGNVATASDLLFHPEARLASLKSSKDSEVEERIAIAKEKREARTRYW